MSWFGDNHEASRAYNIIQGTSPHKGEITHELLAGAAAYEASKAYEKHCAAHGKPTDHAKAKELIAGASGAFIDRVVETKGLNFIDAQKAKHRAREQAEASLSQSGDF